MKSFVFLCLFGLCPGFLWAQPSENLGADAEFFKKQTQAYQAWLTQTGLDQILQVQDFELRADTLCILYLGFQGEDADSVQAQWQQAKADYAALGAGDSLENALFERMVYLMSIQPHQAEIRLFNTYDLSATPCFARRIYRRNGQLNTVARFCRSEERQIKIEQHSLKQNGRPLSSQSFQRQFSKEAVFKKIKPYLEQKYSRSPCDGRYPTIRFFDATEELFFEVKDLCKEVLTDEQNPWWCETLYRAGMLSKNGKNCIKRERLVAHIQYENTGAGFLLRVKVDAAFGSGWYDKPRDNGYHDIQSAYPEYLRRYADKLNEEIRYLLLNP